MTDRNETALREGNPVLREREAAAYLSLAPNTLNKWRITGDGPHFVRLTARAIGYLRSDLDAFLAGRRCRSTSERLGDAA